MGNASAGNGNAGKGTAMRPSPHVLLDEQDGQAFLLHVPSGRYFGLNSSGVTVWRALERGDDPAACVADAHPQVAPARVHGDVERLLGALVDAQLVTSQP